MNSHGTAPGSVVVAVDGSHHSDHAVDWAARHAADDSRTLVLLHAVRTTALSAMVMAQGGSDPTPYLEDGKAAGRLVLDAAYERAASIGGVSEIEKVLVTADPRTALMEFSDDAQILVLGSRGRGPVSSLLLGSVSAAVAGHARCPVVVVRPHHPGIVRRGVLVGADGTAGSLPVLDFAFRQASELDLPLTILHGAPGDPVTSVFPGSDGREAEDDNPALTLSETVVGLGEKFPEVSVSRQVVRGRADAELLRLADVMDLVVVGHRRRDLLTRALSGSVALGVVEHAATVVAIVPQS